MTIKDLPIKLDYQIYYQK